MRTVTIADRQVRLDGLILAALAALAGLGIVLAVTLGGGHGTSASQGMTGPTPPSLLAACEASRLANGDQQQQSYNPVLAEGEAKMWCSYGPAFDTQTDTSVGVGPNTAPWPLGT